MLDQLIRLRFCRFCQYARQLFRDVYKVYPNPHGKPVQYSNFAPVFLVWFWIKPFDYLPICSSRCENYTIIYVVANIRWPVPFSPWSLSWIMWSPPFLGCLGQVLRNLLEDWICIERSALALLVICWLLCPCLRLGSRPRTGWGRLLHLCTGIGRDMVHWDIELSQFLSRRSRCGRKNVLLPVSYRRQLCLGVQLRRPVESHQVWL